MSPARTPVEHRGDYLRGRFVKPKGPDGEVHSTSPRDPLDEVARFPFRKATVDEAVQIARRAQSDWAGVALPDRVKALRKVKAELINRERDVIALLVRELGTPRWEAWEEFRSCLLRVDQALGGELRALEAMRPEGVSGRWSYRPRGAVAILGSDDAPMRVLNDHVVSALLTGNTVVVQPSALAPALGQLYAEIVDEADLPKGVFNLIHGDASVAAALAAHPGLHCVLYLGRWEEGERLRQATLHQHWKSLVLATEGKNPVLVLEDADLAKAAKDIVFGAYAGAGQHRTATCHVLAHRKIAAELQDRLRTLVEALEVGDPEREDVFMGPLRTDTVREVFLARLAEAEAEGAEAVVAARIPDVTPDGWYVTPALHRIAQVYDTRYQTEVLPGPDLALFEVRELEEAVALANSLDYGLVASVFTRDERRFEWARARLEYATVNENAPTIIVGGRLPFGGLKRSGNLLAAGGFAAAWCTVPVATHEG